MLSEISQTKTNTAWYHLYVESTTHRYREQTSGYQWGDGEGEGKYRGMGLRGTNNYVQNKL